jgi:hypothetical protein
VIEAKIEKERREEFDEKVRVQVEQRDNNMMNLDVASSATDAAEISTIE